MVLGAAIFQATGSGKGLGGASVVLAAVSLLRGIALIPVLGEASITRSRQGYRENLVTVRELGNVL